MRACVRARACVFIVIKTILCISEIRSEIINLEEENKTLKRELGQTKKELEETLGKLTTLNKNKKRMEKAIFKQIFETKHILKRARVNLEDGSSDTNVKP